MRLDHVTDFCYYYYYNFLNQCFGTAYLFSNDSTHSKTIKSTRFIALSPIQSRHLIIFQVILLSFTDIPRVANMRPSYSANPEFPSGTASTPQSLIKLQRSGVFKELPNGDMIFFFFFCFWPLRCSTRTHSQSQLINELPFTPSPGNILTRVYESLNAFEQVCSALDLLDCCKMPTMPPTWPLRQQKKAYSNFLAGLVSSRKLIKLQHMLATTH
jgi:hypothetical protein